MESELFTAKLELQQNQCRLNDVRDAMAQCIREWDELQGERKGILSRIVEITPVE